MQFRAYIVITNSSPAISMSLVGIVLFIASIPLWAFETLESTALVITVCGVVLVVIGGILSRQKPVYEGGKQVLSINNQAVTIGDKNYPFTDIEQLNFYYHSFYSQSPFGYFKEASGLIEYGMHNRISFMHNKE
jgi:hypothetical protein